MQFHSDAHARSTHDRSRGMHGERSRNHFMSEQREKRHELESNREAIRKALNDGYEYDGTIRERDSYNVRFVNRENNDIRTFRFMYEASYERLNSFWWKKH